MNRNISRKDAKTQEKVGEFKLGEIVMFRHRRKQMKGKIVKVYICSIDIDVGLEKLIRKSKHKCVKTQLHLKLF